MSGHLVLDRVDSLVTRDERTIKAARRKLAAVDTLRFDHLSAAGDPMLWIPDAIA